MGRRRFAQTKREAMRAVFLRFFAVLLGLLVIALAIDFKVRPVVKEMSAYYAKVFAIRAINEAILSELESEEFDYGALVQLGYGETGEVSTIQADMVAINRLKGYVARRVMENFSNAEYTHIKLPVGTLFGGQFFAGRGPLIDFKMAPAGIIIADVKNRFDSAGINQTRHQIMLEVQATVIAVIPAYTVKSEVLTSVCVAETVIVGDIPQGFAQIGSLAAWGE